MKPVTSSPPKRKLQDEKKANSSEDLDTKHSDKHSAKSKKLNFNVIKTFTSISKDEDGERQPSNKKKTKDVDLFEEREEKKKRRAILYEKYLQRGGARNPGSKTIPTVRIYTFTCNYNHIIYLNVILYQLLQS